MLVKIHRAYRITIAICDENLIDKIFEDGEKQLDLTGSFFRGEEKTEEEVKAIIRNGLREDSSFNIVGRKSCALAKEFGLIKDSGVLYVDSVPVALVLC